jgi:hypothetical protein
MGLPEILLGLVLVILLFGLTLIFNPPSAWVDKASDKKKKH